MKAFVVNRVGDFGFILGLFLLFWRWAASGSRAPTPARSARAGDWLHGRPGAPANPCESTGPARRRRRRPRHPLGPTLTFRELRDQIVIQGTGVAEHLRDQSSGAWRCSRWSACCFFVGAMGKIAQLPLYVWLPDAMAGPTPVSALIHAATMVTAGVYMVARLNFIFACRRPP